MSDNILQKILKPSARGRIWRLFALIILIALVGGIIDAGGYYNKLAGKLSEVTGQTINLPSTREIPFHLGLDLLGGSHLVYRADMSQVSDNDRGSALEGVRDVIERRVNVFGVSEPIIQTSLSGNEYRVVVELAGIKDVNEAIAMIGETPLLEFKEEDPSAPGLNDDEQAQLEKYNSEAEAKAEEVLGKLISGGDFAALATEYSEDQGSKENSGDLGWVTEGEIPELIEIAKKLNIGEHTKDLVKLSFGYDIIKLEDKRNKANPFNESEVEKEINASHLLICYSESEGCESGLSREEALNKIKEIAKIATPKNFAELVAENTTEPGGAEKGGDLGWFSRGMMVEPFEDAVFPQAVETISFVVETKFGYHLIYKKSERPIEEYKVSHILIRTLSPGDVSGQVKNWKNTELTGRNLKRAIVQFDQNDNSPEIALEFDDEGSKIFDEVTARNVGKSLGIFLDGASIIDVNGDGIISPGEVYAPTVNERITGGRAVINGIAGIGEAKTIVQRLNAGALPVPIELINQQTVGASLGKKSLEESLFAGLIGLFLVAIFMVVVYRLPGVLSVFSLLVYGIVVLALFKLIPVTLSLAGMAGFILSIGMAVDANVLIFERLKEELKDGRPIGIAIDNAFERAWPSIRDGNISTLITTIILMWFSTSIIKGFAVTLFFGVLISMFSAIVVTKNLLNLFAGEWLEKKPWLIGLGKKVKE